MYRVTRTSGFVFCLVLVVAEQTSIASESELESLWNSLESRRSSLDDIAIAVRYDFWNPKSMDWDENQHRVLFIKRGHKIRWEEFVGNGLDHPSSSIKTINVDDGVEFWSHQTRPDFQVSSTHDVTGGSPIPAILWLGTCHPHPSTSLKNYLDSNIVLNVLQLNERLRQQSIKYDGSGKFVVDVEPTIVRLEFSSKGDFDGEILSFSIENKKHHLLNDYRTEPKIWMVEGKKVIFPASVTNINYTAGKQTSGIRAKVLSVDPAPAGETQFSITSLDLPIGQQVNDLVVSNVGHWDGKKPIFANDTGADTTDGAIRKHRVTLVAGVIVLLTGLFLYVKSRRH